MSDLLLDTCALIWLAEGGGKLSEKAVTAIDESRFVYVSALSAWEIALLCSKGQLCFSMPAEEWFSELTQSQDIQIITLSSDIAFLSCSLPMHHKDPADRFILATGISRNLTIVTTDEKFEQYEVRLIG